MTLADQRPTDALHQMALAHARRTDQHTVAALAYEVTGGQFKDHLLLDTAVEFKVELVERLQFPKARRFGVPSDLTITTHNQFVLKDQLQELGVVQAAGLGFLQSDLERLGKTTESKLS